MERFFKGDTFLTMQIGTIHIRDTLRDSARDRRRAGLLIIISATIRGVSLLCSHIIVTVICMQ